jgi:hypothetical protein
MVVGEATGFVTVGQALEVVAMGYAHASPCLAQVARLANRLPWYLHHQPINLPSLPGRSSISNNSSFHLKHPGVPDGSDGSDQTSYPLTENFTLLVAQATGRVSYLPPLPCVWYTHHQNNKCVTLLAGAAVML